MISAYLKNREYLKFELLNRHKNLHAFALTKSCGNISFNGDEAHELIKLRRQEIQNDLGILNLIDTDQVHGTDLITPFDRGPADGFYTDQKNVPLLIKTADCQAALFYEPHKHVLAVVHAGWRGIDQKMYTKTVETLIKKYQIDVKNLWVAIAPSIGGESFEFKDKPPLSISRFPSGTDRYDLKRAAEEELLSLGIQSKQLEIAPECTYLDQARFFSYRRDKTTLRQGLIVWLT